MNRLPTRLLLPVAAGVVFAGLCFAGARQEHITDIPDWHRYGVSSIGWEDEPTDIGTPADILLLVFNLPALIALLPLLPLTYWVESEVALRTAWGLGALGQWYVIGRYVDIRRGLLPRNQWTLTLSLRKILFIATMAAGGLALGMGSYSVMACHSTAWAFVLAGGMSSWGMASVLFALRWRSSPGWREDRIDSLKIL